MLRGGAGISLPTRPLARVHEHTVAWQRQTRGRHGLSSPSCRCSPAIAGRRLRSRGPTPPFSDWVRGGISGAIPSPCHSGQPGVQPQQGLTGRSRGLLQSGTEPWPKPARRARFRGARGLQRRLALACGPRSHAAQLGHPKSAAPFRAPGGSDARHQVPAASLAPGRQPGRAAPSGCALPHDRHGKPVVCLPRAPMAPAAIGVEEGPEWAPRTCEESCTH